MRGKTFLWKPAYERVSFPVKTGASKGKGLDLGAEPPLVKLLPFAPPRGQFVE